jgi:hypothetical protein
MASGVLLFHRLGGVMQMAERLEVRAFVCPSLGTRHYVVYLCGALYHPQAKALPTVGLLEQDPVAQVTPPRSVTLLGR